MDRKIIYPGQIPLETDLLGTNRNTLVALGKLTAALLGTSTQVSGLPCTPTAPASLSVLVGPGEIYSLQSVDATAYGSLPADPTGQIVKQGMLQSTARLACPAPAASGQSIAYLIEACYQDLDGDPVALPYYNASNPVQAYTGPNNSGAAQNTTRRGVCTVVAKPGVSAPTGAQQPPSADPGYVGLWVVTVAYGQGAITAGNIAQASGAPFIMSVNDYSAPTQQPGDRSNSLATTAFVHGEIGNFKQYNQITSDIQLTSYQAGTAFQITTASTITLPQYTTMSNGGLFGGVFAFVNNVNQNATIKVSPSDAGIFIFNNQGNFSSIALGFGDTLTLVAGGGGWFIISGSMAVANSSELNKLYALATNPVFNGQIFIPEGSVSAPGLTFKDEPVNDTGLYHISDGHMGVACDGIAVARFGVDPSGARVVFDEGAATPAPASGDRSVLIPNTAWVGAEIANGLKGVKIPSVIPTQASAGNLFTANASFSVSCNFTAPSAGFVVVFAILNVASPEQIHGIIECDIYLNGGSIGTISGSDGQVFTSLVNIDAGNTQVTFSATANSSYSDQNPSTMLLTTLFFPTN